MGNSNSSHKITAQDRAILDMKNQRDQLQRYQKRIGVLTARETAIAKECLARGDKDRALLALRRKKYQESLVSKTDAQLEQLQKLTSSVEFALVQKDVVFGIRQGTRVLRDIHREMGGIENVEKILGESEDARAYQREVSDLLAGGALSNDDEDEVEDELEALEREVEGSGPPAATKRMAAAMPDAPDGEVVVQVLPGAPADEPSVPEEEARERAKKERARARAREQKGVVALEA